MRIMFAPVLVGLLLGSEGWGYYYVKRSIGRWRMVTITPRSTLLDVQRLRESIYRLGDQQVRVSVERGYDVEYVSGYTNLDVITFSWGVDVDAGGPFDAFYFWLEAEGYTEYITLIYSTWETLSTLSEIFHITAGSIVIEDDGSVDIRKTLLNNGVEQ